MDLKIRSITDVITNSSSEAFLVRSYGKTVQEILKDLKKVGDNCCSGMGGELEVYNSKGSTSNDENWYNYIPEEFAVIDLDWAKKELINYIFENYWVLDIGNVRSVARHTKTGRIVGYGHELKDNPKTDVVEEEAGTIINKFSEYFEWLETKNEIMNDEKGYLSKVKEHWKWLQANYPKNFEELKSSYKTPEGQVAMIKVEMEEWFNKHKINPSDEYKY